MATPAQAKYLQSLLRERNLAASPKFYAATQTMSPEEVDEYIATMRRTAETLTVAQASAWIDALKKLPLRDVPAGADPNATPASRSELYNVVTRDGRRYLETPDGRLIPEGSYALDTSGDDRYLNDVTFFKLWLGTRSPRAWGLRIVHGPDESRIGRASKVVDRIAEDPARAAARFGHEIGRCGVCGRQLTNDESRARGIGPVCAERNGW